MDRTAMENSGCGCKQKEAPGRPLIIGGHGPALTDVYTLPGSYARYPGAAFTENDTQGSIHDDLVATNGQLCYIEEIAEKIRYILEGNARPVKPLDPTGAMEEITVIKIVQNNRSLALDITKALEYITQLLRTV